MVGLLVVVHMWPDTEWPHELVEGFIGVGFAPWCRVFEEQPAKRATLSEALEGGLSQAKRTLDKMRAGPDDKFITETSLADTAKGWATPPMTWAQMRQHTEGRPIRLIRRFAISQANGKRRVIDDATDGGQSGTSEDANKLQFCSALRPAQHLQLLWTCKGASPGTLPATESVTTGGEDGSEDQLLCPQGPLNGGSGF